MHPVLSLPLLCLPIGCVSTAPEAPSLALAAEFRSEQVSAGAPSDFPATQAPSPGRPAQASSTDALVPLPSVFDFTRGGGLGVALGLGLELESAYDGSDEYELEVDPAGAVQYRSGNSLWFWEGIEAGWRGRVSERTLLQLSGRYESGREASDSEDGRLDGLDEVDDHLVGAIELRYALDEDWRSWLGGRVMAGESDFGVLGVLAGGYRFGDARDGTGSELFGFATFGDSSFINKDFGITSAESAASGLPVADLDGGFRSLGLQFVHRAALFDSLQLIFQAGVEFYGDEIQKSAIARDDLEAEIGAALVWVF